MIEAFFACASAYQIAVYDEVLIDKEWAQHILEFNETELANAFILGDIGVEDVYCYRLVHGSKKTLDQKMTVDPHIFDRHNPYNVLSSERITCPLNFNAGLCNHLVKT